MARVAAVLALAVLAGLLVQQLRAAMRPNIEKNARVAAVASAIALVVAGWVMLARADILSSDSDSDFVRVATWVLAAAYLFNAAGNLVWGDAGDRRYGIPLSLLLAACFVVVALS